MSTHVLHSGYAKIYLEGKGAIAPLDCYNLAEFSYCIGSSASKFQIIDRRYEVNLMARAAIANNGRNWSPQLFSTGSFVEIFLIDDQLSIVLEDWNQKPLDFPVLWMGVMSADERLANPVRWLRSAAIEYGRTAFVGVLDPAVMPVEMPAAADLY